MKEDKIPYLIRPTDQELFAFAGLYDVVKDVEGKPFVTFAIITTEPNEIVAKIHNRMPVILTKIEEDEWLDPESAPERLLELLDPYPAQDMEAYPIS